MAHCVEIRPLLHCSAEGEAEPAEAIRVARHLSDCTQCKILLARESRLAEMLETNLTDLPIGDDFARQVMARLPEGPHPRRSRKRRRGLKLAGIVGALAGAVLSASQWAVPVGIAGGLGKLWLPGPGSIENVLARFAGLVRFVALTIESVTTRLPFVSVSLPGLPELLLFALVVGAAGLACSSMLLTYAAGSVFFEQPALSRVRR